MNSFGNYTSRPQRKIPNWPGPAHGYKIKEQKGYIGVHTNNVQHHSKEKIEVDEGFQHYHLKTGSLTPRYSFGMASSAGKLFESEKRPLPIHLRHQKKSPGPGYYESATSIEIKHRASDSMQDSTWAKVAGGSFIDIAKSNPGPGHYSPGRTIDDIHKPKTAEPGFAF